jgi:hypothetical protein
LTDPYHKERIYSSIDANCDYCCDEGENIRQHSYSDKEMKKKLKKAGMVKDQSDFFYSERRRNGDKNEIMNLFGVPVNKKKRPKSVYKGFSYKKLSFC